MSALPWFRMHSRMISDPKVMMLEPADRWYFVALLCCKNEGHLDTGFDAELHEECVAKLLGLSLEEAAEVKKRLARVRLIDAEWQPRSWEELQKPSDNSTARVRAHRAKKRARAASAADEAKASGEETGGETGGETQGKRFSNALDREEDRDLDSEKIDDDDARASLSRRAANPSPSPSPSGADDPAALPAPDDPADYLQRLIAHHAYPERDTLAHAEQAAAWREDRVTLAELDAAVLASRAWFDSKGETRDPPLAYLATVLARRRREVRVIRAGAPPRERAARASSSEDYGARQREIAKAMLRARREQGARAEPSPFEPPPFDPSVIEHEPRHAAGALA